MIYTICRVMKVLVSLGHSSHKLGQLKVIIECFPSWLWVIRAVRRENSDMTFLSTHATFLGMPGGNKTRKLERFEVSAKIGKVLSLRQKRYGGIPRNDLRTVRARGPGGNPATNSQN